MLGERRAPGIDLGAFADQGQGGPIDVVGAALHDQRVVRGAELVVARGEERQLDRGIGLGRRRVDLRACGGAAVGAAAVERGAVVVVQRARRGLEPGRPRCRIHCPAHAVDRGAELPVRHGLVAAGEVLCIGQAAAAASDRRGHATQAVVATIRRASVLVVAIGGGLGQVLTALVGVATVRRALAAVVARGVGLGIALCTRALVGRASVLVVATVAVVGRSGATGRGLAGVIGAWVAVVARHRRLHAQAGHARLGGACVGVATIGLIVRLRCTTTDEIAGIHGARVLVVAQDQFAQALAVVARIAHGASVAVIAGPCRGDVRAAGRSATTIDGARLAIVTTARAVGRAVAVVVQAVAGFSRGDGGIARGQSALSWGTGLALLGADPLAGAHASHIRLAARGLELLGDGQARAVAHSTAGWKALLHHGFVNRRGILAGVADRAVLVVDAVAAAKRALAGHADARRARAAGNLAIEVLGARIAQPQVRFDTDVLAADAVARQALGALALVVARAGAGLGPILVLGANPARAFSLGRAVAVGGPRATRHRQIIARRCVLRVLHRDCFADVLLIRGVGLHQIGQRWQVEGHGVHRFVGGGGIELNVRDRLAVGAAIESGEVGAGNVIGHAGGRHCLVTAGSEQHDSGDGRQYRAQAGAKRHGHEGSSG